MSRAIPSCVLLPILATPFAVRGAPYVSCEPASPVPSNSIVCAASCSTQAADLIAPVLGEYDWFGSAVAVSGNVAIVGAPNASVSGAAYVYARQGNGWALQAALLPSNPTGYFDEFGTSVAIHGNTAVVGAPGRQSRPYVPTGAAYVFERFGQSWREVAILTSPLPLAGAWFGHSVGLHGSTAVVGAPYYYGDSTGASGAAFVFERRGDRWVEAAELSSPSSAPGPYDGFGWDVAISGPSVVIGAPSERVAGLDGAGAVYTFEPHGSRWELQSSLVASDPVYLGHHGISVAIDGNSIIAGAVGAGSPGTGAAYTTGAAYVFERTGQAWNEQSKLVATDSNGPNTFGCDVEIRGGVAIIGGGWDALPAGGGLGSAYVFRRQHDDWNEEAKLVPSDPSPSDGFGFRVAICAGLFLVSAPFQDVLGVLDAGSVHVFEIGPSGN